jgi:hypothetical protein
MRMKRLQKFPAARYSSRIGSTPAQHGDEVYGRALSLPLQRRQDGPRRPKHPMGFSPRRQTFNMDMPYEGLFKISSQTMRMR